ncbi:MAG: asparagine synthase (glutamine-hydrolyzing) [Cytophagales bacterium]|nr:asparagine synthase (glutamine-hydrolyzing) [Cytophagales bacterium]
MCGINLIINKTKNRVEVQSILAMNKAIIHRGRDFQQAIELKSNQQIWLGHTRLEIIDCNASSHQPFVSQDERYALIFNGEIYNYLQLKAKLQKEGVSFESEGDGEVLFQWLIHKGINTIQHLEGMFAFAFVDTYQEQIWLVRDQAGMKPLHYFENDNYLIASSEIQGIFASGLVSKELDVEQITPYLHYRFPTEIFFKGIKSLESGKVMECFQGQIKSIENYSQKPQHKQYTDDELLKLVEDKLQKSVEKHLQADVPIGLFLSGGVDSTLLLALLQEIGYPQMQTFSIIHDEKDTSFGTEDTHYTRLAVEQYGAKHTELHLAEDSYGLYLDFVSKINQPIGDGAFFLTYLLSQKAKEEVKVVWSGAGADEYFGGYNRHHAFNAYLNYFHGKPHLIHSFQKFSHLLPTGFSHPLRKQFQLMKKMTNRIHISPKQTFLNFTSLNIPFASFTKYTDEYFDLQEALEYDQKHYLVEDVLSLSDQASMMAGIEMRMPYLDTNLIHLLHTVSAKQLVQKPSKWILKKLLQERGGSVYTQRKKEGFGIPFGQWIRRDKRWLSILNNQHAVVYKYLNYSEVQKIITSHLNYRQDFTLELWSLLLLSYWLEYHFSN